jgi:putative glutamine amidotransferase
MPSGGGEDEARDAVETIDGLLLPGGPDLNPELYGQEPHEMTVEPDYDRDIWETMITKFALIDGVPLLGICRGMQLLNVTLGGTLWQHIPDLFENAEDDAELVAHDVDGRGFGVHPVVVTVPSLLSAVTGSQDGEPFDVPTRHHQAVNEIGEKLQPVAFCADGICEAVELISEDQFALGVQWHPERGPDPSLFLGLVKVAASRRA